MSCGSLSGDRRSNRKGEGSVLSEEAVDQLVEDVEQMARELVHIARSDKDPARRAQAERWLRTWIRESEYAIQCRDDAARRRGR
jgi:predicted exporter